SALDDNSGSAEESALRSYFARIQYNYDNKYYFQGNIRRDGSSRFAPDYRWSIFPSISVGWVLSNEDFFNSTELISFFKIRTSFGKVGNERIGNYPYQSSIVFNSALFYSGGQVVSTTTGAQQTYTIPDISWETTTSIDVGFDLNLFQNRLQTTFDYYTKET